MLEANRPMGIEGLTAKRLGSRYSRGERSSAWLKVKNWQLERFVVVGVSKHRNKTVAALHLARDTTGALAYVGSVEGRSQQRSRSRRRHLAGRRFLDCPVAARAVVPRLLVDVRHVGFTPGGVLRTAMFVRLAVA